MSKLSGSAHGIGAPSPARHAVLRVTLPCQSYGEPARQVHLSRAIRWGFELLACVAISASGQSLASAYSVIKGVEDQFPIPVPYATAFVGTYNAATGTFNGLVSRAEIRPPDATHLKPWSILIRPKALVNGVHIGIVFALKSHQGAVVTVTTEGITVSASPGHDTVTIDVGNANEVAWTIRSGAKSFSDRLILNRPPIVGAGAFRVPVLPIAIIYEPPPDAQRKNVASYTVTRRIGSTISMGFSQESSTEVPSSFNDIHNMVSSMKLLATAVEIAPGVPEGAAIGSALKTIASALGDIQSTQTTGSIHGTELTMTMEDVAQTAVSTGDNDGGPGIGDVIYYLRNARLVWLAEGGRLRLALLGCDAVDIRPVGRLGANPDSNIAALLRLDPFVEGGPDAPLAGQRFRDPTTYEISGGTLDIALTHTVSQVDRSSEVNFTATVEDYREGWLSFVGVGVSDSKTVRTKLTHSSAVETSTSVTTGATARFFAGFQENYAVTVYYDAVFGTFAFEPGKLMPTAMVSGSVLDEFGEPVGDQLVVLQVGGRKYVTRTGANGLYAFRSQLGGSGPATLTVGSARLQRTLQHDVPITGVRLRVHRASLGQGH